LVFLFFFFLMLRRPQRSTRQLSSAASDVYKRQGLCPDCGIALATAEPGHHHDKIDPRWAKLANFGDDQ
ncbi:hypothetical protein PM080_23320, partial [Mycobacteroides abscessus subsp. abscessus]|nr:hypothetical protein [Mycobacteroides abscessus subsp. abscessus]